MYVHNSEGVDYKEPKLKVMGIEIVRSSTPQWCRKALKKSLMMIFETSEESFRENFDKNEKEFKKLPPEEIAFPRGVSDIDKWFDNGKIKKGCPMHVRAALLFNLHTSKYPGYQQIQNGDKIKFVYLKLPNPIKENVIGIPAGLKLPKELGLDKYVDYTTQFEKTFEMPLRSLTDCAGWHVREVSSLEGFLDN
jgi:DNA polymerase elongation subunit (family B)